MLSVSSLPSRPASHFLWPCSHCPLRTPRHPGLSSLLFPPRSRSSLLTLPSTRQSSTKYSGAPFQQHQELGRHQPRDQPHVHALRATGPGGLTWELTTPTSPKHETAPNHCLLSRAEQHRGEEVLQTWLRLRGLSHRCYQPPQHSTGACLAQHRHFHIHKHQTTKITRKVVCCLAPDPTASTSKPQELSPD